MSNLPSRVLDKNYLGLCDFDNIASQGRGNQLDFRLPDQFAEEFITFPGDCNKFGRVNFILSGVSVVKVRV
jgi:hypothetical protein